MVDFYFRENGIQYPAEEYIKANLVEFINVIPVAKNYLNDKLKEESQPTEINFVKYPHLGDELFNDFRIASEGLDSPKEQYNQSGGVAIYIKDEKDQNLILKNGYRDLRIGYISMIEHYSVIQNIFGTLHELTHFRDPYSSSINYAIKIYEKKYQQNTELFIQHRTRHILNEFYANYRTYKFSKSILVLLNLKEFDIRDILETTIFNLKSASESLNEQLNQIKNLEESYFRFDQYLKICFQFFESIFRTYGKWHGLRRDFKEIDKIFIKLFDFLKKMLGEASLEFIIEYLNLIESLLNPEFKKEGNIEEMYKKFNHLGSRYPNVLNLLK